MELAQEQMIGVGIFIILIVWLGIKSGKKHIQKHMEEEMKCNLHKT